MSPLKGPQDSFFSEFPVLLPQDTVPAAVDLTVAAVLLSSLSPRLLCTLRGVRDSHATRKEGFDTLPFFLSFSSFFFLLFSLCVCLLVLWSGTTTRTVLLYRRTFQDQPRVHETQGERGRGIRDYMSFMAIATSFLAGFSIWSKAQHSCLSL